MPRTVKDLDLALRDEALGVCEVMMTSALLQVAENKDGRVSRPKIEKFGRVKNGVLSITFCALLQPEGEPLSARCVLHFDDASKTIEPVSVFLIYGHSNRLISTRPEVRPPSVVIIGRQATKTSVKARWQQAR